MFYTHANRSRRGPRSTPVRSTGVSYRETPNREGYHYSPRDIRSVRSSSNSRDPGKRATSNATSWDETARANNGPKARRDSPQDGGGEPEVSRSSRDDQNAGRAGSSKKTRRKNTTDPAPNLETKKDKKDKQPSDKDLEVSSVPNAPPQAISQDRIERRTARLEKHKKDLLDYINLIDSDKSKYNWSATRKRLTEHQDGYSSLRVDDPAFDEKLIKERSGVLITLHYAIKKRSSQVGSEADEQKDQFQSVLDCHKEEMRRFLAVEELKGKLVIN